MLLHNLEQVKQLVNEGEKLMLARFCCQQGFLQIMRGMAAQRVFRPVGGGLNSFD